MVKESRNLNQYEIKKLEDNGNRCTNWSLFMVKDPFDPDYIQNSSFNGSIIIDSFTTDSVLLNTLTFPVGIYNSYLKNTQVESNCAIHSVRLIENYIIKSNTILFDIGLISSSHKKIKLPKIEAGNENGSRYFYPHSRMNTSDIFLAIKYGLCLEQEESHNISFSIGPNTSVSSVKSILNSYIGSTVSIQGTDLIENSIIMGGEHKTVIGYSVHMQNGILHEGCEMIEQSIADSFIMMPFSSLSGGVRFIHSVLGENSHIAGCEIQNSLLFPFHEQHHSSSFLCSAIILGQCNIAAGATIGSNHNSRRSEGELITGRGFWPGLNVSIAYPSHFASFTLISKGMYESSLNIPFPFSLIAKDNKGNTVVMAGYYLLYNLYALYRNQIKFGERERRNEKTSIYNFLDVDTVYEMLTSIELIESIIKDKDDIEIVPVNSNYGFSDKTIYLLKGRQSLEAYRRFCELFCLQQIIHHEEEEYNVDENYLKKWMVLDNYRFSEDNIEYLCNSIRSGNIRKWDQLHKQYKNMQLKEKGFLFFAVNVLKKLYAIPSSDNIKGKLKTIKKNTIDTCSYISKGIVESREKDYLNPLLKITFHTQEEAARVYGSLEEDDIIVKVKEEMIQIQKEIESDV